MFYLILCEFLITAMAKDKRTDTQLWECTAAGGSQEYAVHVDWIEFTTLDLDQSARLRAEIEMGALWT